jgi:uncharacterized protein (TIGR02246 family)
MISARLAIAMLAPGLVLGCASPPATSVVDVEAERAAIEQLAADWSATTNQAAEAGADGYVSVAAEDVVVLPPNGTRVDGRQAVRDWALQYAAADGWAVTWTPTLIKVAASGDVAYAVGTYEFSLMDPDGNAVTDQGKFLDTFEKQADGTWMVTVISFNSDLPIPGTPTSEE